MTDKPHAWSPVVGNLTRHFLAEIDGIPQERKQVLLDESLRVVTQGGKPGTGRSRVGLVVGYVQSGKTLSLTTVSALARDNGYGHIIVLCGVTRELFQQNMKRMMNDLVIRSGKIGRHFIDKANPRATEAQFYRSKFELWKASKNNPTIVTFLLKNAKNIQSLSKLLKDKHGLISQGIPTLVIDDEAHMAGLNTAYSKEEESNVYAALKELRSQLPDYAYLQYTATPQAPLLVHLADCVSPEFAVVLSPGKGYVGGKQFFPIEGNKDVVIEIPAAEEPEGKEPPMPDAIPDSLKEALHYYLLGVAHGISKDEQNESGEACRSMLIHPHSQQITHERFHDLAKNYVEHIQGILRSSDEQEKDELREELQPAYRRLKATYPQLNTLEGIMSAMPAAIEEMKSGMLIVNAKNKESISWKNYANVLIGGEVLGVGFTVKGLTVSYMLRTSQKGQIDSMQQRARFFGYREKDMGLTRVYLSADTHKSFRDYVRHEETTREALIDMERAGKSLKEWRRNFLVSSGKQLTRKNIQSMATLRSDAKKSNHPQRPWLDEKQNLAHLELLRKVQKEYGLARDTDCKRTWTENQQHLAAYVPAEKFIDDIIASFSWADENDSARWISAYYLLRVMAKEAADANRPLEFKVMVMRPSSFGSAKRGVTAGEWELLQGRGGDYPGDKKLADPDVTTIQLHCYNFVDETKGEALGANVVVPIIIPGKADEKAMQFIVQND